MLTSLTALVPLQLGQPGNNDVWEEHLSNLDTEYVGETTDACRDSFVILLRTVDIHDWVCLSSEFIKEIVALFGRLVHYVWPEVLILEVTVGESILTTEDGHVVS